MKTLIEMAREAGCIPLMHPEYDNDIQVFATPDVLKRFAELVRADEREACAGECDEWIKNGSALAEDIAAAIRARSNT